MTNPSPISGNSDAVQRLLELSDPLIVIQVFVEALRQRFSGDFISDPELDKWTWLTDLKTTKILIESGFNENAEARNKRPGLWVDRVQHTTGPVSIGYQGDPAVQLSTQVRRFYANADMDMVVDCTASKRGESMQLASIAHMFLLGTRDVIMGYFGIRDISPIHVGRTGPYEKDKDLWNTPISFRVSYEVRWNVGPYQTLLDRLRLTLRNVDETTDQREVRAPAED